MMTHKTPPHDLFFKMIEARDAFIMSMVTENYPASTIAVYVSITEKEVRDMVDLYNRKEKDE